MSTRTLSVSLPSDALYVSGTVNDVAVTWTNTEGNTWEAVAARADDDVYRVSLTIINSLGTATTTSMTLYYGLHLITLILSQKSVIYKYAGQLPAYCL